ncbi:MAG: lipoate--protein ligase family protein [Candidatus Nanohaloarchaea archaeon]
MKGKSSVKVLNGKLVKAEVEVEDDELKDVDIRGDFFIEPPEALEEMEKALEGLPENVEKEDIIEKIDQLEGKMIGFSAEDVAEAVTGAVKKTRWRIIDEGEYSEAMHHAIDEVLTERMKTGEMQPTLRFWYRKNDSVPMGRFQAYKDEVEHEYAEEKGVEVVRRLTGGGAMFCEPGNVITYSIYIPKDQVPGDVEESYRHLDEFAVKALNDIGVDAGYEPLNDIEHEDGKLGGAAQLRSGDVVLHHTTMSYRLDTEEMLKVLRIGKEKISDKAIKSAEKRVSRIADHTDLSREEVVDKMIQRFVEDRNWEIGELTEDELEEAEQLAEEKFSTDEWNKKL